MLFFRKALLLFFLALNASCALACSIPGLEYEVDFKRESENLTLDQMRDISMWFIDNRDRYGLRLVYIFAIDSGKSEKSKNIKNKRIENIVKLLAVMTYDSSIFEKIINKPTPGNDLENSIYISIQPSCITSEINSCCPQLKK